MREVKLIPPFGKRSGKVALTGLVFRSTSFFSTDVSEASLLMYQRGTHHCVRIEMVCPLVLECNKDVTWFSAVDIPLEGI